ncbi:MAG: hypothetical protein ACTHMM_17800 [Agriterribacter sp.]
MKTFLHSGSLGDVIYSLPTIKALGGGILYLKHRNIFSPYSLLYHELKALLIQQPCIHEVRLYPDMCTPVVYPLFEYHPGIHIDFDLDRARLQLFRNKIHIVRRHLDAFNLQAPWTHAWLTVKGSNELQAGSYSLIHLTPRWRVGSAVDWRKVLHSIQGKVYFIGYQAEWVDFCSHYGNVEWYPTEKILDMAILIRDCKALYGNQSVSTTIAQGIGVNYYLEKNPKSENVLMYTPNEILL